MSNSGRSFGLVLLATTCAALLGCERPTDGWQTGQRRKPRGTPSVVTIATPVGDAGRRVEVARYETRYQYPVLEELRKRDEAWKARQSEETERIRKAQKARKERRRVDKKMLQSSLPEEARPTSVDAFQSVYHHPPVAQFMTGTCWAFAATSLLESEVHRLTQRKIKLSEMGTVYYEHLAKTARFVRERGDSELGPGSQPNAVTWMWQRHGAWPAQIYPGVTGDDLRHDHQRLEREFKGLLGAVRDKGLWDEQAAQSLVQVLLDQHLGAPPASFEFEGKTVTPTAFVKDVLKIEPKDYVSAMSTLAVPFHSRAPFDVPDNWWKDDSYHNVPLDEFYAALKGALQAGFSLTVALDVSEPGKDPLGEVMFVPDYDIPPHRIDQLAREYRFAHRLTTDDHGVHLVGLTEHDGHDWFLAKDSGRSSRRGKHEGYYFIRDDYVRLKVLTFTVHRDAVKALLAKFEEEPPDGGLPGAGDSR